MPAGALALDGEFLAIGLLFVLAVGLLVARPFLTNLARQLPFGGDALSARIEFMLTGWIGSLTPLFDASIGIFSGTLDWLNQSWRQLTQTLSDFAHLSYALHHHIVYDVIPQAFNSALQQAGALVREEYIHAETLAAAVAATAESRVEAAEHGASLLFQQAETNALQLAQASQAVAAALVARAESEAMQLVGAERDFTLAESARVEAEANALFAQAMAISAAAEAALRRDVGVIADLERQALTQGVTALELEIAKAKEVLTQATAVSIGAVAADVAAIRAMRCIQQCNVLGALGEFLNALDVGLIVGLAVEYRQNPQAVNHFLRSEVMPVVQDGLSMARETLGS